jgi:hypothetical protein
MRKDHSINLQSAQGMVEFALVLPILLLVIFGIFAFGHFFFAYSSVVSASRDAARWGSAVGLTDNLLPRYQDCEAIRAAAVRTGAFAGVQPVDSPWDELDTPGIYVGFDHGPDDAFTVNEFEDDYDSCLDDEGPSDVAYGDRINVRVTVLYRTIVPLINIPTIPITATTSRTIVHTLPVGENPIADPACRTSAIDMDYANAAGAEILPAPVVGQPVYAHVLVRGADGTFPPGTVLIRDNLGNHCSITVPGASLCLLAPWGYGMPGTYYVDASFDWTGTGIPCYQDQEIDNDPLVVDKADTSVTILSHVDQHFNPISTPGEEIFVTAQVTVDAPGAGMPTGIVTIAADDGESSSCIVNAFGTAICRGLFPLVDTYLTATYHGDIRFNPSTSDSVLHEVETIVTEPPPYCPFIVENSFQWVPHGGQMQISNANGTETVWIQEIEVSWPPTEDFEFDEVRFGALSSMDNCTGQNCLWDNPNRTASTPPWIINSTIPNWDSRFQYLDEDQIKAMRLVFNDNLPNGPYSIQIRFSNGCELEVSGDVN